MKGHAVGARQPMGDFVSNVLGRYLSGLSFLLLIASVAVPRVALAHAHLVKSLPAAGAHVAHFPETIQLWFSEAAEATLTKITIMGPDGKKLAIGPVRIDASNPLLLIASVGGALAAGKYNVDWRTVAKDDGHPSNGTFAFTVDSNRPAASGVARATDTALSSSDTAIPQRPPLDIDASRFVIARWLNFAAIVCVLGVVAFRLLVIPGVIRVDGSAAARSFAELAIRRAAGLGFVASVAAVLGSASRLYAERAVVGADVRVGTILQTYWGQVWSAQMAIAVVSCVLFALARRGRDGGAIGAWLGASVVAVLMGAAPAFSGHAMAATQYRGLSVILDIVHVLAAGGWVGGLFAVATVGIPAALVIRARATDPAVQRSVSLVAAVVNAFSPTALAFASLVVASGAIAAYLRVGSVGQLFHSNYGIVLLIKLCFVVLVLAGGAFNWLRMRGALSHRNAEHADLATFRRSAWLELTAAVLVLAATAVLVAAQPPVR